MNPNLPHDFVDMISGYGPDYAGPLLRALDEAPSVSVRANALKGASPLAGADLVAWCPQGFYLPERPLFAADPAWHQGLYYVQDASSMIYGRAVAEVAARYFDGVGSLRYLDACAAPGGKSIAAVEALPPDAIVVSNELDRHRANILLENIVKEGAPASVVCRGDAGRLGKLREAFDIIAVDAPCSGEGMMRKEPEAVRQWSRGLIADCARIQQDILGQLWRALRPGGVLIYSTCTFNRSENEENAAFIASTLGGESIDLGLLAFDGVWPGIDTGLHCYRLAPGHVRGEGLFIAAFRKPGEASRKAAGPRVKSRPLSDFCRSHIADAGSYVEVTGPQGAVELRPRRHEAFIAEVASATQLLRGGLTAGTVKGRDMIPSHDLALSSALLADSFPHLDLDYAGAMAYLRGESLADVPDGLPHGFVLARYGGRPLGFLKNLGRRANNLYPDSMRLRLDPRNLPASAPQSLISLQ